MKTTKTLLAAVVLAASSLGSIGAQAADISNGPQALAILDNTAYFGDTFAANNMGNTFMDRFVFDLTGIPQNIDAIVASVSNTPGNGLDITGFDLYSAADTLLATGTGTSGAQDVWTLSADSLAAGGYYLLVSGVMLSDSGGSFGGAVMLNPVPEPETYGMMLAGLGVVGFLARRRSGRAANQA